MSIAVFLIFAVLAAVAIGLAAWPVLHGRDRKGRPLLAGAIAAFVLAIGAGIYLWQGQPQLALRTLKGPQEYDLPSLVATLASRVLERPNDISGWVLLGRGYLTLNDPGDAARAFAQAIAVADTQHHRSAELYSAYGEAQTRSAAGIVTPNAESAFRAALAIDPKDFAARYYLGFAYAMRGQSQRALALWQALLADAPINSPLHGELVDRIAVLKASSRQAPDVSTMVEGLAARLKTSPNDSLGWQRLVRAYVVLGKRDKAMDALAQARAALRNKTDALAALDAEAKALKLEK